MTGASKRGALANHRPWLLVGIIAAVAFYVLRDGALGGAWVTLIKGSAVGALAIYAIVRGRGGDAHIFAAALGLAALGDMAIEFSLVIGGAAFFCAHVAAMALFLRFPRAQTSPSQKTLAVMLLLGTPFVSWLLSNDPQIALYGLSLGGMAACAWMSRFTRYRVGAGAVLFVVSDWLIFSELGTIDLAPLPQLAIWPLYFLGQFLIATGVVQTLRHELDEAEG
jgi:hypothetical protein